MLGWKEIIELKFRKREYFLDNSKFIFDYFENKKNISEGGAPVRVSDKNKILNCFFKIKDEPNDDIANQINQRKNSNIVQKYLSNISYLILSLYCKFKPLPMMKYICSSIHFLILIQLIFSLKHLF